MREHVHTVDDAINMHEHLQLVHDVDGQTLEEASSWRALHTQLHEDALCPKCHQPMGAHGPGLGQISNQGCKMVELHLALEAERSNRVVVGEMWRRRYRQGALSGLRQLAAGLPRRHRPCRGRGSTGRARARVRSFDGPCRAPGVHDGPAQLGSGP